MKNMKKQEPSSSLNSLNTLNTLNSMNNNKKSHHCYIVKKEKETKKECLEILKTVILPFMPPNERIIDFIEENTECRFFVEKLKLT